MKAALIALLFAASTFAQTPQVVGPAACGAGDVNFDVKLDKTQHTLAQPEAGKALIYFILDAGTPYTLGYPTIKLGIDGAWVGANKKSSYFSVSVAPGEHHLCVTVQSHRPWENVELTQVTAEAGKVYFYRTRLISIGSMELNPVVSDEAKYLIDAFPLSTSRPRKDVAPKP